MNNVKMVEAQEGEVNIGALFGGTMGKNIIRKIIQEERKRTSILLGGINV